MGEIGSGIEKRGVYKGICIMICNALETTKSEKKTLELLQLDKNMVAEIIGYYSYMYEPRNVRSIYDLIDVIGERDVVKILAQLANTQENTNAVMEMKHQILRQDFGIEVSSKMTSDLRTVHELGRDIERNSIEASVGTMVCNAFEVTQSVEETSRLLQLEEELVRALIKKYKDQEKGCKP